MPYLQSLEGFQKDPFSNMIKLIIVLEDGVNNGSGSA